MAGTAWLARRWLRARRFAVVPLLLVVAVGGTGAMVALSSADRTANAFRDHLDRANVGDLVLNPSLSTKEIDEVIRALPGVEETTTASAFTVTRDDGHPRPRGEVMLNQSTSDTGVMGSHDGRFVDMDRPIVVAGRMATGPREAVLTVEAADAEGLGVGDEVTLAFWRPGVDELAYYGSPEEAEAIAAEIVSPLGVEQIEIVGVVQLSNEVLPDDLYPRQLLIVSPDVAARYDCLPEGPAPGSTLADALAALVPEDCARNYRYFSLRLAGGARGVKPALDEFLRRVRPLNADLATISDLAANEQAPPQYYLIPIETDQERQRVEQAARPSVTALRVLGAAIAAVTVALAGFAVAREVRRVHGAQRQWYELGVGTTARVLVLALPPVVAVVAGSAVALAAAWFVDTGATGLLAVLEPGPRRGLDAAAILAMIGITAAIMVLTGVLATSTARRGAREPGDRARDDHPSGRGWASWPLGRSGPPAVTTGLRAAAKARTTPPVVAGIALLTGALVAAMVFGASLSALVSTPRSYGWPWDVAAITGVGYGDLDLAAAQQALDDDPDVARWTALGLLNEVSLNGEPMMSVVGFDRVGVVELPSLEGTMPLRSDQVAIGAKVAKDHGLSVGDTVDLGGVFDGRRATVSGIVVFPTLGPFMADRVGTGTGLLLSETALDDIGPYGSGGVHDLATFVGVELHDGVRDAKTAARLGELLSTFDRVGSPVFGFDAPVRPAPIIDARSMRAVPVAVGVAFAVVVTIGLAFNAWSSARARRHELAVLRALGFRQAQVRASVCTQAVATMAGALVIGVPLGVVAGRALWRAFADELGVVPDPASSWRLVLVTVAGGLVAAIVTAWFPARFVTRSTAADLRSE